MKQVNNENYPPYVKDSMKAFRRIMADKKQNGFENMSREHKGELFVLHYLAEKDADVFPSDLSTALKSSPARVSALLKSLEKKGQIERHVDVDNRRNVRVRITEAGRAHSGEEMQKLGGALAKIFIEMGEKDATEYLRLLELFFELSHKHFQDFANNEK
ncbi:MAG: transcriptional regulator [Turicibacter sp.]|nr:transcriptional regulator [Turicibacter sp.]